MAPWEIYSERKKYYTDDRLSLFDQMYDLVAMLGLYCKLFVKTGVKHQREEDRKQTGIASESDSAEVVQQC